MTDTQTPDPLSLRNRVIREITVAPGWNKADATVLVDDLITIVTRRDRETIDRLTRALRVNTHDPHDQAGDPDPESGFPVCSDCGAIQTAIARPAPDTGPAHEHDPETCVGCANTMAMAFESGFRSGIIEAKNRLSRAGMHDGKCHEPKEPCTCGLDAAINGEGFTQ